VALRPPLGTLSFASSCASWCTGARLGLPWLAVLTEAALHALAGAGQPRLACALRLTPRSQLSLPRGGTGALVQLSEEAIQERITTTRQATDLPSRVFRLLAPAHRRVNSAKWYLPQNR
jgi:hypothetical protein